MSSNLRNLMAPNHHIDDYNHSNNKIMHNNHTTLHPSNTSSISTTITKKEAKNKSPSPPALSALSPMSPMSALSATAPFPIPAAVTYRSQLNPKNRKRVRAINDNYSSLSPNINNSLKRQRRKLDSQSQIQLNNKRNSNIENVEDLDLSETVTDYTDDDYVPPLKSISIKSAKSATNSNANSNEDVVGYRKLNWRKQQVATPKFVLIDKNGQNEIMSELSASAAAPPKLRASASTMEMYGVLGDKLEDTSNEAYFYRHYRAEAREKFFYEELFESRLKQQQILEEKEKRRKKKQKRTRKKSKKNKPKLDIENNGNNVNDMNSDDCDYDDDDDLDVDGNDDDDDNEGDEDCMPMDLALPKLPTGPWSYKLGAKYDKRPQVPQNVKNRPTFNYNIPFEKLQRKQFITDLEEKKKLDNWWEMPPNLIRRTDYGNMANIKVKINPNTINVITKNKNKNNNVGDLKKKQELIELYQQLKQKMKKSEDKKKKHKHKHKHKKKDKYHKKNKDKHKNKDKDKHKNCKEKKALSGGGPVDVRLLLKK